MDIKYAQSGTPFASRLGIDGCTGEKALTNMEFQGIPAGGNQGTVNFMLPGLRKPGIRNGDSFCF